MEYRYGSQRTATLGVVDALSDVAYLEANLKAGLGCGGIFAQAGAIDFQPQPLGALVQGQELGF